MTILSRSGTTHDLLRRIADLFDRNIDVGDNIRCKILDVPDTGTLNVEFSVKHNLGTIPRFYVWNIDRAGIVYDSNRATWTESNITLKCSVSNAVLKLIVF